MVGFWCFETVGEGRVLEVVELYRGVWSGLPGASALISGEQPQP
jgi:hypothetical protein